MKKKKISEKENEWKGILQEDKIDYISTNFYQVGESNITPDSFTVTSTNVNGEVVGKVNLEDTTEKYKKMYGDDYSWCEFTKDKKLQDTEEEHCNIGINKDWENSKFSKNIKKIYEFTENDFKKWDEIKEIAHENWVKDNINYNYKRIDFEFTPFTFWQLLPSIAVNLHCKEIELTWLCFGCYINFKRIIK